VRRACRELREEWTEPAAHFGRVGRCVTVGCGRRLRYSFHEAYLYCGSCLRRSLLVRNVPLE
jgi:hypothetical protein